MKPALALLALLLSSPAVTSAHSAPAVPAFMKNFNDQQRAFLGRFLVPEQILLAGALTDETAALDFAVDAQALAADGGSGRRRDLLDKWRVALVGVAKDYVAKYATAKSSVALPNVDLHAATVEKMVPVAESMTLEVALEFLEQRSWLTFDPTKADIFRGRLKKANEDLLQGKVQASLSVISQARARLVDACARYLVSPEATQALKRRLAPRVAAANAGLSSLAAQAASGSYDGQASSKADATAVYCGSGGKPAANNLSRPSRRRSAAAGVPPAPTAASFR